MNSICIAGKIRIFRFRSWRNARSVQMTGHRKYPNGRRRRKRSRIVPAAGRSGRPHSPGFPRTARPDAGSGECSAHPRVLPVSCPVNRTGSGQGTDSSGSLVVLDAAVYRCPCCRDYGSAGRFRGGPGHRRLPRRCLPVMAVQGLLGTFPLPPAVGHVPFPPRRTGTFRRSRLLGWRDRYRRPVSGVRGLDC